MIALFALYPLACWALFGGILGFLVLETGEWPWFGVFILSMVAAAAFVTAVASSILIAVVINDNLKDGDKWWEY